LWKKNIIKKQGNVPVFHILSETEYAVCLNDKLKEETEEYLQNNSVEELCVIFEVITAICASMGISVDEFQAISNAKALLMASFATEFSFKKLFLNKPGCLFNG
jgi:predicted house-cleaning noncanonical NTP pyrophosphatase (MazG superfamily)